MPGKSDVVWNRRNLCTVMSAPFIVCNVLICVKLHTNSASNALIIIIIIMTQTVLFV